MQSKEISKEEYTRVLFLLINLHYDMQTTHSVDLGTLKLIQDTIDMLRYYRQFAK